MIKQKLKEILLPILQDDFFLDIPNSSYGDFASNIAFGLAKKLKQSPKLIAEELAEQLQKNIALNKIIETKALNGFLNFVFSNEFLWQEFTVFLDTKIDFPVNKDKILLEYVSANPTGPLHIGHGRWAVIGDILTRVFKFIGVEVSTEFYINDAGNQIQNFNRTIKAIKENSPIPEDGYHGQYMYELAKEPDPLAAIIDAQRKILADLDVNFDTWFYESSLYKKNAIIEVLDILSQKELTYQKEGALWFKSTKFGDEKDRVLVKNDTANTYFLVDLAYHLTKLKRGFTYLINIWGADHHGYVLRVQSALKCLSDTEFKFKVIIGQLVSLYRDNEPLKMSKRTGEMITLEEVFQEIGKDALRFFMIQKSPDQTLDFDLELAKKNSNENPVFYLQYAYARICSILAKFGQVDSARVLAKIDDYCNGGFGQNEKINLTDIERKLILKAMQIHDEIYEAANNLAPYRIANYLLELVKIFHVFYEKCPILKAPEFEQAKRIFIILKIKQTFALGFDLLGITKKDFM
ncbi:MAG: arginine--tRNA ligase [Candidatus Margulisiibacteriota bacterium]|jgi:arginyl-tRNA synthetase